MDDEFTIKQAAQRTGLSIDTLHYYERIGLIEPVKRNPSGHRRFTQNDLAWIELLLHLRDTGMPLAQLLRFARLRRQDTDTLAERRLILEEHQRALEQHIRELEQHLQHLKQKIARFKQRELEAGLDPAYRHPAANETTKS